MRKPDDDNPAAADFQTTPSPANPPDDRTNEQTLDAVPIAAGRPATFPTGKILESRFRILRILGRGGMGEVYEADDLVLKENVALKTLLPQIAVDEHSRARFRREVLLARKVTHPNVCRIFDVFGDTIPISSGNEVVSAGIPFMTMELLQGQTLSQFLQKKSASDLRSKTGEKRRRLTPDEALPLVAQMVAALDAAHQVGVVHRDFKSSNVFLAERPGVAESRVVVTDFGLARISQSEDADGAAFTGRYEFVGTPVYMSPEQVEGGDITPATDIYALGVVLYEMMTGAWPFMGKTPRETANLRLKSNAAPPRSLVSTLDTKWNAVILRCLEREPADRFQSAGEVLEALTGDTAVLRRRTRTQRERLRKGLQAFAAVVLVLAAAFSAYRWWPHRAPTGNVASAAVVRFQNLSQHAEKDWIGASLGEALTRELAASERLRVVPAADVARMRQELVVPASGEIDAAKLDQIRANLGAYHLLLGDYELSGQPSDEQIRVTVRIVDPDQPSAAETITETGHENDLFELSDRVARSLRSRLNAGEISAAARAELRAALPTSNAASRAYFDGLEKLRQFDPLSASDFLKDAVRDNPDSPLPHLALSQAWDVLGYDQQALAEAKRAQETSQGLSKPEQREIECRVLGLERVNWDDAIGACRGLWVLRKRLDDGLRLANVQFSAEKWNDAVVTLASLRNELQSPEKNDPRIDVTEAQVREALTQFPEMEQAAKAARDKAQKQGAHLFEAQALLWMCVAQQNRDKFAEAREACTTANDIFHTVGDRIGEARARTNLAHVLTKLDDPDGAIRNYEEALKLATSVGSMRDRCDALMNYGAALYDRNDLKGAEQKYQESLKVGEQSENRGCQGRALESLGSIARDKHNFDSAGKQFGQAAKIYAGLNMSADLARLQSNIGDLLWQRGDPNGARALFEDAAKRRRDLGLRDGLAITLGHLGDVRLAQDESDAALAAYKEAQAIETELHQDDDASITEISIAQALIETGDAAQAENLARKLVVRFSTKNDADDEVFARDVLVRALFAQHRDADAVSAANELRQRILPSVDADTRFSARITVAQALATQKSSPRELIDLRTISAEAHQKGFVLQELSADLALAESENLQGITPNANAIESSDIARQNQGIFTHCSQIFVPRLW